MALSVNEIRERIKNSDSAATIARARQHQRRVRFHVQTSLTAGDATCAAEFGAFVRNLIPEAKYKLFLSLLRYPLKTTEVTSVCFDKLSRIFDGRNPAYNYQFMNSAQRDDWEDYRQRVLHEPDVWSTKGWEYFKTEINSVLVVDVKRTQTDAYPEPYFYWLPIDSIEAFDADEQTGVMRWIAFQQDEDRMAYIDAEAYYLLSVRNGGAAAILDVRPHDLGYCPARFFWDEPISLQTPFVKASPITKVLAELDWYLFYATSKQQLDLYGSYPIYSGYAAECDYVNSQTGETCCGGKLKDRNGNYILDTAGSPIPCPVCGPKRIAGVGSFVEVPIPSDSQPDLRNPVQMLTVDRNSLDYNVTEAKRLRTDIITSVVGTNEEVTTREALNEQQVRANFESQSTVLNRIKRGFESAQQFVDETVCRLRYGGLFISAKINYGTEFYMFSAAELRERYKIAKANGASEAELDALHQQVLETEYRHNPTQLQRMIILSDLEPYQHLTRDEVVSLYEKGHVSAAELAIKLDFTSLVKRFERENANILEFGTAVPYQQKIKIILKTFKNYVSQSRG